MLSFLARTMLLFLMTLPLAHSVSAMTERRDPVFRVEADLLEQGQVHYSFHQLKASTIQKKLAEVVELDGARLLEREGATIQLTKLAYVVNKPAGFFSSEQTSDVTWLSTLLGQPVKKITDGQFQFGKKAKLRVYFDSDDLTTVKSSRFVHAVTQSKKLDPIALSGFSTVVMHTDNSVQVDNHVSLSPKKTLVISYQLSVVNKGENREAQRLSFIKETQARLARTYP